MKIIEFVGLPGSGKSTICDELEKQLKNKGYKVANLQKDLPRNTFFQKIYRKYIYKVALCSLINKDFRKVSKNCNIPITSQYQEWIERIQILNYRIHTEISRYDYILLDEGLLQFITSLYHGVIIDNKEYMNCLMNSFCVEYLQYTMVFNLNLNTDLVCKRLKSRNKDGDRFVLDDEEKMKLILEQKKSNLNFVTKVSNFRVFQIDVNCANDDILNNLIICLNLEKG